MPYGNMMAAGLHVSVWTGVKVDDSATQELLEARRADGDAGKFSKLLVPKKLLRGLDNAHGAARREFRRLTLPFDHGMGLVTGEMFDQFRGTMTAHKHNFEAEASKFVDQVYPAVLAEAQVRMAGLYDARDFPSQDELRQKFRFQLTIFPVPHAAELKLQGVSEAVEAELRTQYEGQLEEHLQEARREVWERVLEPATRFAEVMAEADRPFRATTVEKLREIVDMAPRMCLTPDPALQETCDRLRRLLTGIDAEVLRENGSVRGDTATEVRMVADDITRRLAWMNGSR